MEEAFCEIINLVGKEMATILLLLAGGVWAALLSSIGNYPLAAIIFLTCLLLSVFVQLVC